MPLPIFVNGTFDDIQIPNQSSWEGLQPGTSLFLPGWTILGRVDLKGAETQSAFDTQAIDLDAVTNGALKQTVDTSAKTGQTVKFTIDATVNPYHDPLNPDDASQLEGFEVHVNDVALIPDGESSSVMFPSGAGVITTYTYSFVATGSDTVTIRGVDPGNDRTGAVVDNVQFVCFAEGTLIDCSNGLKPVQHLRVGDLIRTKDRGFQPIRWIGSKKINAADFAADKKLRPVRIKAGALGSGLPEQDLLISRQHRVLVRSEIARRMFGSNEVLVPAIHLISASGIEIADDVSEVEYFHLLFDRHEIIRSNGAWTESLFTGKEALKSVSKQARIEIRKLFPEVFEQDYVPEAARDVISRQRLTRSLVARHTKNTKWLYTA